MTPEIKITGIILSFLLLVPVIMILNYYKTGLITSLITGVLRMTVQLMFVGVYLKYIFIWNHPLVNVSWIVFMSFIAALSVAKKSDLSFKKFALFIFLSIASGSFTAISYFVLVILQTDNPLDARILIPVSGIILGNCLSVSIIALRKFFEDIEKNSSLYFWLLSCGAKRNEALKPYLSATLKHAFSPSIAGLANMGLIWLPGMMTGQILGGSDPSTAVSYQIVIMIVITAASMMSVYLSLLFCIHLAFDDTDCLQMQTEKKL